MRRRMGTAARAHRGATGKIRPAPSRHCPAMRARVRSGEEPQ